MPTPALDEKTRRWDDRERAVVFSILQTFSPWINERDHSDSVKPLVRVWVGMVLI